MRKLKKRQREILQALRDLGGRATTKEIAAKTGFHVNGVSQSLGVLSVMHVRFVGGKGGSAIWEIGQ